MIEARGHGTLAWFGVGLLWDGPYWVGRFWDGPIGFRRFWAGRFWAGRFWAGRFWAGPSAGTRLGRGDGDHRGLGNLGADELLEGVGAGAGDEPA